MLLDVAGGSGKKEAAQAAGTADKEGHAILVGRLLIKRERPPASQAFQVGRKGGGKGFVMHSMPGHHLSTCDMGGSNVQATHGHGDGGCDWTMIGAAAVRSSSHRRSSGEKEH